MWSIAEIFGAPVTDPPGNVALEQLGQPDVLAQPPLDGRDHVDDPGELLLGHQLRPAHGAVLADPRQVVPLEVDDHHVLGGVLLGLSQLVVAPSGRVPLIGFVQTRRPRLERKSSGEAETTAQPSPASGARLERPKRRERSREPGRVAAERRGQMLDEVDLVDVAGRDRRPNALDGSAVLSLVPGRLPLADAERTGRRRGLVHAPDPDCGRRQRARLGRVGDVRAAQRPRQPVPEIHVGDEAVAPALEEPCRAELALDVGQRAKRLHTPTLTSRL